MAWVCPNCSNTNSDDLSACFVCGMDKPTSAGSGVSEVKTEDCTIVFSDFDAFIESMKHIFKPKEKTTDGSKKTKSAITKTSKKTEFKETRASTDKRDMDFDEPWPEHRIKFNVEMIKTKGFVRAERKSVNGVNGYNFYKKDGTSQFIRLEVLLIQKMAYKI